MSATNTINHVPGLDRPVAKLCLTMSKLFLNNGPLRRFGFRKAEITRFDSMTNWVSERVEQISDYVDLFSPFVSFEGKTVLELGSNRGYLLDSFLQNETFDAIGAEIDPESLDFARKAYGDRIKFVESTPDAIPLDDESVDVIYTIDTVEHLSDPRAIFDECLRVLRPGGTMLVHFSAWFAPYGSHLEDIIPIPWANSIFSMDTLLDVAAHLYESPDYDVACYYIDEKTGGRRPNPFLDKPKWEEFLNRITIRKFRRLIREMPFEIVHFENIGFGGKSFKAGKLVGKLSRVPVAEEFFTKATFAVLRKPAA